MKVLESLADLEVDRRLGRLRTAMSERDIEALVVSRLANVRYLTGFTGSAATLVVNADGALFVTDGRYDAQSREQTEAAGVELDIRIAATATDQEAVIAAEMAGVSVIALEEHGVTWAQQMRWDETFDAQLVPAGPIVEDLRRVKDAGEVARIRAACAIGDDVLAEILPTLAQEPTEIDVALRLELEMRRRGASGTSFDPIVAAGANGAKPHARPTARRIERGELVVMDFGCIVDGYCSDMTRTVSVGEPSARAAELWGVVREAQELGRDAVAADVATRDVDAACRDHIVAAGLGPHFSHSTGHGVGIEIHEDPRVSSSGTATLRPGDVVTVEPGVYVEGVGGVRIEDTVLVTEGGCEPLTTSPKQLVV